MDKWNADPNMAKSIKKVGSIVLQFWGLIVALSAIPHLISIFSAAVGLITLTASPTVFIRSVINIVIRGLISHDFIIIGKNLSDGRTIRSVNVHLRASQNNVKTLSWPYQGTVMNRIYQRLA
jgi:hypothetical protein